jgi:hypothetical protein
LSSASELVVSSRDERKDELRHQRFPRHSSALVGTLGNAAKERKQSVRDVPRFNETRGFFAAKRLSARGG